MKRFIKYSWQTNKKLYFIYSFITILLATVPIVISWVESRIIDQLTGYLQSENVVRVSTALLLLILSLVSVRVIKSLLDIVEGILNLKWFFVLGQKINFDFIRKASILDVAHFENNETHNLLNTSDENVNRALNLSANIVGFSYPIIGLLSSVVILASYKPSIILFALVAVLPAAIIDVAFGRKSYGIWGAEGAVRRDYYKSRWYLIDAQQLLEVRVNKLREFLLERVYGLYSSFEEKQTENEIKRTKYQVASSVLLFFFGLYTYLILVNSVISKEITLGEFTFYISMIGIFSGGLARLLSTFSSIYRSSLFVDGVFKVFDLENKIVPGERCLADNKIPPRIEFRNVDFFYPTSTEDNKVLVDFNLIIKPGEKVALVGVNGAGKTTIVKLLMRIYDVTGGEILIDNIPLKDLSLENWYSKIGALFQEFNFYHFDAKTNIATGDPSRMDDIDAVVEAAKKSGAHSFIKNYEYGYDQVLSTVFEKGIIPSAGQKQKIAVARTFFKDAPILILDEPTSAIDAKAEFEIFENIYTFSQNKTVITISHRFSTVRNADRILVLEKGKILEDGSHNELMLLEDGVYKKAFELQKRGYV
ncbi:ABC transporter ATP-binding protein [Candidatus Nomurabacteria bacterium]|uniref:ABC transporter ATP-binding protein n=1 Tax=candidate division WWE3 bacterium TaxID=2053526 RepID=A0A955DZI5_UNCKA|nr:ABC transporter ATP-binding protein [candidate division WWE3 bacterium]MCB9823530.1 ABC transporter ATP-binding protein [Candidatus Nomurabacteria bacterium]MCB9827325.1 ABC transporter ATP-binding protein [Candidatus Nomurabacteria bacterium]HXK52791.1 ABC transporter ATP-binding protein [bacterium]